MSLREGARKGLEGLNPFSSGDRDLGVAEGHQRLNCKLVALDKLACAFETFALHTDALAAANVPQLKKVAETLAARLTYLLEAISPIEVDDEQCVVQLRSSPPQKDSDGTSYYELLVRRGGELSLSRYKRATGSQREMIPANVTREVFLRLVDDFSTVAG